MRIVMAGMALILGGCVFTQGGRRSQWKELDAAGEVSCSLLPLPKDAIAYTEVHTLKGGGQVDLLAAAKKRNASTGFYGMSLDGPTLKPSAIKAYPLVSATKVIGGGLRQGRKVMGLVTPQSKPGEENAEGQQLVQLLRESAQPQWSQLILPVSFEGGHLTPAPGGYWLSVRHKQYYQVGFFAEPSAAGGVKPQWAKSLFASEPTILPSQQAGQAFALALNEKSKRAETAEDFAAIEKDFEQYLNKVEQDGGKAQGLEGDEMPPPPADAEPLVVEFSLRQLHGEAPSLRLDLPTDAGVEDWAAIPTPQGFKLAFIEGDSLAGRATLHIAVFAWAGAEAKRQWIKSFPLADVHISDLTWLEGGGRDRLMLLKWVDGERTLASYQVSAQEARPLNAAGVFPVESAVIDAFALRVDGQQEAFAIMRTKDRYMWQFEMCHIGSL